MVVSSARNLKCVRLNQDVCTFVSIRGHNFDYLVDNNRGMNTGYRPSLIRKP